MKENKGITLIALTITIIVTIILSSIIFTTVKKSNTTVKQARISTKIYELQQVQQVVIENYIKYKQIGNEEYLVGTKCNSQDVLNAYMEELGIEFKSTYEDYYILDSNDKLKKLGIENSEDYYIVNYKTGEVFNYTAKKTEDGNVLYINGKE